MMASSNPCFRTDLVAQPIVDAGHRFVDVTDPDSGKTFRFYEVEYSLACAMDGRRDLDQLANWALDELGLEASRDELESVIGTLADLGYLEGLAPSAVSNVPVVAEPVELGQSGGVAIGAETPVDIPVEEVELGAPGRGAVARERPPLTAEPIELGVAGPAGQPPRKREDSFEGLLEGEEPPTTVRPSPPRTVVPPAPVALARGRATDDFLEGITPPPQEHPTASLRPVTQPQLEQDGPTLLPQPATDYDEEEVSVDLSAHLSIGAEDVKEAVRQSRVMQAVEVPADVQQALEPHAPPGEVAAPALVEDVASRPIELPPPPRVHREERPAPAPARELPQRQAQRSAVSPILWILLILAIGGAGAYYYFFVYKKKDDGAADKPTVGGPAVPGKDPGKQPGKDPGKQPGKDPGKQPDRPPAWPSATVEAGTAAGTVEVKAPAAGMIPWLADAGAQVKAGDVVVQLKDYPRHAKKLAEFEARLLHYQGKLDKAQKDLEQAKANNAAGMIKLHENKVAEYQDKVKEKQDGVDASRKAMAAASLTAPDSGTVERVARPGQWVKEGEVLVKITGGPAGVTATFTVGDGKTYEAGSSVKLGMGDTDMVVEGCTVDSYAAGKLTVSCPPDSGLKPGAQVTLR